MISVYSLIKGFVVGPTSATGEGIDSLEVYLPLAKMLLLLAALIENQYSTPANPVLVFLSYYILFIYLFFYHQLYAGKLEKRIFLLANQSLIDKLWWPNVGRVGV